ncbi:PLP-dependent aminotransferase family protein [bacterium LRH843]|nr:PLP-dependent aminotransferase family protein [bacterium LRH843]
MKYAFADRVRKLQPSAVRDMLKVVGQGNVISFAGGLPDDDLFPIEGIEDSFSRVFATGKHSLQYGATEGYLPLRETILKRMKKKGITGLDTDQVLVTTGSQQAIDLFSRIMLNPGDVVLTEDPTYLAALQVFNFYEANVVAVECDENGMIAEDLERKLEQYKPKFVYVVPTFSNPTGYVWSLERRKMLLDLVEKHNVIVLEDDPYGEIQFEQEETYTPLLALDGGERVIYTSTFSKIAVPGLRTGWVAGPEKLISTMAQAKQANDLHSDSISQQALYQLSAHFDLDGHIENIVSVYKNRMEIMVNCLEQSGLKDVRFVKPKGGMFLWVEVSDSIDTVALFPEAVEKGVAFVPGEQFFAGTPKKNTMRLNFTHPTPEEIERGMKILADLLASKTVKIGSR